MTNFSADIYQNEFLPDGGTDVNAVVTVTATTGASAGGPSGPAAAADAAEVIMIDMSGSMNYPPAKFRAAQHATEVAIDCIRDGVWFALIAGTKLAHQIYPQPGWLVPASGQTRSEAKAAVTTRGSGRHRDRRLAQPGEPAVRNETKRHPPCHPPHRRKGRERDAGRAGPDPRRMRGPVSV